MTNVEGLGLNIQKRMTEHFEKQAINAILESASLGQTTCKVKSKGLTFDFLERLGFEGIESAPEGNEIIFIWDGVEV